MSLCTSTQRIGAFGAILIILLRFKTTPGTAFPAILMPGLDRLQILLPQGHIFSPGNPAAQFLVNPIDAAGLPGEKM